MAWRRWKLSWTWESRCHIGNLSIKWQVIPPENSITACSVVFVANAWIGFQKAGLFDDQLSVSRLALFVDMNVNGFRANFHLAGILTIAPRNVHRTAFGSPRSVVVAETWCKQYFLCYGWPSDRLVAGFGYSGVPFWSLLFSPRPLFPLLSLPHPPSSLNGPRRKFFQFVRCLKRILAQTIKN